jgi:AGZA family xanthine/uracil permease-like MFS transporter
MNNKVSIWTAGDVNAFFGFGTNILVNLLTLTALLRFVLKLPDDIVFGAILPAAGTMMCLSTCYYAYLAYNLAKKTGRTDVCALPSGISVPHMFVVVFLVMMPIAGKTGDPLAGWAAGCAWVFFQSFVLMVGGFAAPYIRKVTPRAALLGALAGISISFISFTPLENMFEIPIVALPCFTIILLSWFGGVKYGGVPAGLVAIIVGCILAWGSNIFGLNYGGMTVSALHDSFSNFGLHLPFRGFGHVFTGLQYLPQILVTAIPFGIYDLVEAMDNVESAAAADDSYPTTSVLTADGVFSLIGCVLGNPFINAVYIGHPGWKSMGGRIGYSAATGFMVIILSWFGIISVMTQLIPIVALYPILLYIGMLIGSQAFQETPRIHAPAVIIAMLPNIAAWGALMIQHGVDSAGGKSYLMGTPGGADYVTALGHMGVAYHGLAVFGAGGTVVGMVLGAMIVFIINRDFAKAAITSGIGAALTFVGIMHGDGVGINVSPELSVAYLMVGGILAVCAVTVKAKVLNPVVSHHHETELPEGATATE